MADRTLRSRGSFVAPTVSADYTSTKEDREFSEKGKISLLKGTVWAFENAA